MTLFSIFEQEMNQHTLQPRQIVLAFSGGVDSRVLLDLLATYRDTHPEHHYLVIHIHHGLSANADAWLLQCEEWATELDFAFKGIRVTLKKHGQSLENVAREARYQAIINHVETNALVLTGQHADDQAETFLLALKRGSGVAGLAGMPKIRALAQAQLFRPLLSVSRGEIEQFADLQGLDWIEDESNLDCRFDRNFIRNLWLPKAQERWQGIVKAINRSASHCAQQEQLVDELLAQYDNKVLQNDGGFSIEALQEFSAVMQAALLRRWLKQSAKLTLSQAQIQQVFNSMIEAAKDANPIMQFADFQLRRYQKSLYLLPRLIDVSHCEYELVFQTPLTLPNGIGTLELTHFSNKMGLGMIRAQADETVTVRFDPQGLFASPVGRKKRKLKKLFQEYGIPSWQRRRTPLIFYGQKLVAVADLFVCQGFAGDECELVWQKSLN